MVEDRAKLRATALRKWIADGKTESNFDEHEKDEIESSEDDERDEVALYWWLELLVAASTPLQGDEQGYYRDGWSFKSDSDKRSFVKRI